MIIRNWLSNYRYRLASGFSNSSDKALYIELFEDDVFRSMIAF